MPKRRGGSMPRYIPLRRGPRPDDRRSSAGPGRQVTSGDPFADDFNDTALGRELSARWRDVDRAAKAQHRVVATMMSMRDALEDLRWRGHVLEMLGGAAQGVAGAGPKLQCFTCCRPWSMARSPLAIVIAELTPLERALVAGICQRCVDRGDVRARVFAGLRRDLGLDLATARFVDDGAHA